jgi:hydrogenase maturation protease
MTQTRRIVVLGLGNLIRSDDGVGVHAALRLMSDPRVPVGVEVIDGGTQGLSLVPVIAGATHIVAIDAVNTGVAPGKILRYEMSQLDALPGSPSVHQIGFADLLEALRWLDQSIQTMVLIGVQPEVTGWGTRLSPSVETALPRLVETVIGELEQWVNQPVLRRNGKCA